MKEAEKKNDMKLVKKDNALKRRSEESVERKKLEALKILEEKRQSYSGIFKLNQVWMFDFLS